MNILYVQLNSNANEESEDYFRDSIVKLFKRRGFQNIHFAYTAAELLDVLQDHKDEPFWLFSNFPPNCSYAEGAQPETDSATEVNFWKVDGYHQSFTLFEFILKNHSITQWNIITGAPPTRISFNEIRQLNIHIPIRIVTKRSLMEDDNYYNNLLGYLRLEIKRMKMEKLLVHQNI